MPIGRSCHRVPKFWRPHIWSAYGVGTAALCALVWLIASTTSSAEAQVNVTERSYNPNRTGVNSGETILTPANVRASMNQFHRRFVMKVDAKIEGSPLFLSGVTIAGGVHDVVYVATMHNTVYAFDADTGVQLSARWLGDPVIGEDLGRLKPITIHREWGVAATPVIDLATGTIYVVRWGYENGVNGPTFRLFGLDASDLSHDKFGSVLIDGYNVDGTGFDRFRQMQRAGLALARKPSGATALIVAFGVAVAAYGWPTPRRRLTAMVTSTLSPATGRTTRNSPQTSWARAWLSSRGTRAIPARSSSPTGSRRSVTSTATAHTRTRISLQAG